MQDIIKDFISSKTENQRPVVTVRKTTKRSLIDEVVPNISQAGLGFDFASYLTTPVIKKKDVPEFMSRQPQALRDLYFAICCIPAASCDIERLFSTCGYIDSTRRGSLTSERLEERVLLKKNNAVIEEFKQNQNV